VIVHVEVQQEPDPDMAARLAEYAVRMAHHRGGGSDGFGRDLVARGRQEGRQEGRHEGELHALAEFLRAHFPEASRPAVDHTASLLPVEHGDAAIRIALALESLPG
jgi:hypothetical protein